MIIYKKIEEQTFNILSELNINTPNKIDVFKIAEYLGVDVKAATLDSSISGLFVIKEQNPIFDTTKMKLHKDRNSLLHTN